MPPSADDKLIEDAVQDFSKGLHSDLPLRHFAEFHDQEELKKMVDLRKENVLKNVINQVWTRDREEIFSLMKKVNDRITKEVIAEWVTRNREHRVKSISFLQKWVDMICDNFNMALEYQLLLNPDVEIESLKNNVDRRKQIAINCFESIWKPGNSQIQEERKSKLEKQLQVLEEEVFEKRQRILDCKSVDETKRLLEEVRSILLERSRQLKSYVVKHQEGQVSSTTLKKMVEEMRDYILNGKGSRLRESHEEIHSELISIFVREIQFLSDDPEQKMADEDVVGFAERFDETLKSCCHDNADYVDEIQQDMNTEDPGHTADPRGRIIMQDILNEFNEGQGGSFDLEQNEAESLTDETKKQGGNDGNNNGSAAPEPSTGGKRRVRQHPSRRLFKASVKGTDSDDPAMIGGVTGPKVPPSKKQRTARDVTRKITKVADGDGMHRRSSRLKRDSASHAIPAQTAFPARRNHPRKRKILHDLYVSKKVIYDVDETPLTNSDDTNIVLGDSMTRTPMSTPPSASSNSGSKEAKNFKPAVSMTTKRGSVRSSSRSATSAGHKDNPKGCKIEKNKMSQSNEPRRTDDKACPKLINILEGDGRKYFCNVCRRKFNTKKYLKYHGEFCESTKSFICNECNKGFRGRKELDRHTRVHTGEKPFQCPNCPERFSQKGNLQKHIRRHANDNPYYCKTCSLTFVSRHSLHEHNLSNHEEKLRLSCTYCSKRFDRMFKLRNHVINHGDERPFECRKCGACFVQMVGLVAHIEHTHTQPRKTAQELAYDAAVAYLLKETKNASYHDFRACKINDLVVNHIIKKANLRLPDNVSAAT